MGASAEQNRTLSERGWMTSLQVAERIAGFQRGEGFARERNPKTGRYRRVIHPEVQQWRRRIWEALQAGELTCHRRSDRHPAMFWWSDVTSWAARHWPRQKVRYV